MYSITQLHYLCTYLSSEYDNVAIADLPWNLLESVELVDTVTATRCSEATYVRACWNESKLYFHFHCVDHYIRSDYEKHDDPLYNQDVIEIFIDEQATGRRYIELEVSPHNVVFDAMIENDGEGRITSTNLAWDVAGLETKVVKSEATVDYYVGIPLHNFESTLHHGKQLKINFYRIDEDETGEREYQAWCPTGAIQFHMPQRFGTLILQ